MKRGISLVEVMFVLVLIAVVIVIYDSNLRSIIQEQKARAQAHIIEKDLESLSQMSSAYFVKKGSFPAAGWSNATLLTNLRNAEILRSPIEAPPKASWNSSATKATAEYSVASLPLCCEGGRSCLAIKSGYVLNDLVCKEYNQRTNKQVGYNVLNRTAYNGGAGQPTQYETYCLSNSTANPDDNMVVRKITCQ